MQRHSQSASACIADNASTIAVAAHEGSLCESAIHVEHTEPALVFTEICDLPYERTQRRQICGPAKTLRKMIWDQGIMAERVSA